MRVLSLNAHFSIKNALVGRNFRILPFEEIAQHECAGLNLPWRVDQYVIELSLALREQTQNLGSPAFQTCFHMRTRDALELETSEKIG